MNEQARASETPVMGDPQAITPGWMSAVLSRGGRPVEVTGLSFERIGTGQIGACYRFHLQHSGGAPDTVILKTIAGSREQRMRMKRGFKAEVSFYRDFAATARVRSPHCWDAALSEDGADFHLLMEDADPAVAGAQERGCTRAQAEAALRNLAGLHAPFWNGEALQQEAAWLAMNPPRADLLTGMHETSTRVYLERFEADLPADEAEALRRAAGLTHRWLTTEEADQSLLHGDYRLDNLLFAPGPDGEVLAVDWQTLDIGLPGRDLGYFIATALDVETRRREERELVRGYHDQLMAHGLKDYGLETCETHYRRGMLQIPFVALVGYAMATGERTEKADRMFLSLGRRAARAIIDLDVIALWGG